jgi:hypothetical protein
MRMSEHNILPYPLGSHRQWIETLLLLVAPFLIAYIVLCVILHEIGLSWIFVFCVALIGLVPPCWGLLWNGLTSADEYWHVPWLSDISISLAYGSAEEDGIRFRKWFNRRFVTWRAIERVEYWPEFDGQISLHLYSQRSPIVFVPDLPPENQASIGALGSRSTTVEFISRKLNETWPGKSTFVISHKPSQTKEPGFLAVTMRGLSVRQRALANALFMLLTLELFYVYLAIRIGYHKYFWTAIAVFWAAGLIVWVCARVSRKSRTRQTPRDDKLTPPGSGSTTMTR